MKGFARIGKLIARASPYADVTICIPTWQSQRFIDRTIRLAQGQTHARLRILISVDQGDDDTAAICRAFAQADRRIKAFVQEERLGWARNANFLLDRVDTEFFFMYFHDDIVVPQYTDLLVQKLRRHSGAVAIFSAMGHFGGSDHVSRGQSYEGSTAERLLQILTTPERGSPLRALTRTEAAGRELRLPTDTLGGFWANEPYLLRLVASGPTLYCPETLYFRWDRRSGGLTSSWTELSADDVKLGTRYLVQAALAAVESVSLSPKERHQVLYALQLRFMQQIWSIERAKNIDPLSLPDSLSPKFDPAFRPPPELRELNPVLQRWLETRRASLVARGFPVPALPS